MNDDELWAKFGDRTLSAADWTHAAHLRVAWMFLARYGACEAHIFMRVGIIRLNLAHGLEETTTRGYHETLTRVWLTLVESERAHASATTSDAFIVERAAALTKDAPLTFYSRERLLGVEARSVFVEADLRALPKNRM